MADTDRELEATYVEGTASIHQDPEAWVDDWDLLSPRFQAEATAYIQIFAVFLVAILILRRARRPKPAPAVAAEPVDPPVVEDKPHAA